MPTLKRVALAGHKTGLFLAISVSSLSFAPAYAQQQGSDADAVPLDTVVVEGQNAKKKKAQAKQQPSQTVVATTPAPLPPAEETRQAEPTSGTGVATKPGLNLENPNTGGSRLGLTPLETPASIEVISGDTVRKRGQKSVVEAVTQNAAGITTNASPGNGGTSLVARGFAGHGSVATLFDGTRIAITAGTVTFPFNTWSADRIEVLRGPASVLYGEGAIGGIVNVVPKKPTDTFTHEAEVSLGSDWTRRLSLGSGGPINDKLSYRFDVTGEQSEGWVDDGDFANAAVSGTLRYKASPGLTFWLSHDYGFQEPMNYWGTPYINNKIDKRLRSKNFNVADGVIDYEDNWTRFNTEWKVNEALTLRNSAYRLTTLRHWKNAEGYNYDSATGLVERSDYFEIIHDEEHIGNRFDATLRHRTFGLPMQTVVGFDINKVDLKYTSNFGRNEDLSPGIFIDPFSDFAKGSFNDVARAQPHYSSEMRQYSLFAEHRVELTDQLSVIGGLRYDHPDVRRFSFVRNEEEFDESFHELSWRAGAVYELIPGLAFYGQYATAVDPNSSALLTTGASQSGFELASGRQIEVGVKQSFWNGNGEWTLAGYDIVKTDLLVGLGGGRFQQVGQQSSQGVEASLALQLSKALRIEGNAALLTAQYDDFGEATGNQPRNVPEKVANVWINYAFAPQWEALVGVQYVGERFGNDSNTLKLDDYTVVNAGLDYHITDNSTLSLRGYNVFDEVYAVTSYGSNAVLGRPRSGEVTYRIKF